MNFGSSRSTDTIQSSSDTTGDNSSSASNGQNGRFTPPTTGDGQNGRFTSPSMGDSQNGNFTFLKREASQEGTSFPDMRNGFPGMNSSSSKETIADNLIWYGVSAVVLIGGLIFAITYKKGRRK